MAEDKLESIESANQQLESIENKNQELESISDANFEVKKKESTQVPFVSSQDSFDPSVGLRESEYVPPSIKEAKEQRVTDPKFDILSNYEQDLNTALETNKEAITEMEDFLANKDNPLEERQEVFKTYNKTVDQYNQYTKQYNDFQEKDTKSKLQEANSVSATEGFINALKRGVKEGEIADMMAIGKEPDYEDIKRISQLKREEANLPGSEAFDKFNEAGDDEWFDVWKENPIEITSQQVAQSLSALLRHGYNRMAVGAAEGAALGTILPGPGTLAGAGLGTLAGTVTAGYNLEMSNSILESLGEAGIDITDEKSLQEGFSDPKKLEEAKDYAMKRAVPIAVFDMFTAGVAGKVLGKGAKTLAKKALKTGVEGGIQMAGAAGGETTAQLLSKGKLSPKEIFAETVGELGGGAPDVIVGTMIEAKKKGQDIKKSLIKSKISKEDFNEMIDISEGTGEITPQQATEMKADNEKVESAKESIPEEYKENEKIVANVVEKNELKAELEEVNKEAANVDEAFLEQYKGQQEELQSKIAEKDEQINNLIKTKKDEEATTKVADTEITTEPTQAPDIDKQVVSEVKVTDEVIAEEAEKVKPKKVKDDVQKTKEVGEEASKSKQEAVLDKQKEPKKVQPVKAADKAKAEGLTFKTEPELDRYIAEESQDKVEIAEAFLREDERSKADVKAPLKEIIESEGLKINKEDYKNYGDPNNITAGIALTHFAKKNQESIPLDVRAQELSEKLNIEVTPLDIVDYLERKQAKKSQTEETPLKIKLKSKYAEIGGKGELEPKTAQNIVERAKKQDEKDIEAAREEADIKAAKEQEAAEKAKPTKKQIKKAALDEARAQFRKKIGGFQTGGLDALPEFINVVKAAAEYGIASAEQFYEETKLDWKNFKKQDVIDAYNKVAAKKEEVKPQKETGVKLEETKKLKEKYDIETPERPSVKIEDLDVQAKKILSKDHKKLNKILTELDKGREASALEQRVLANHISSLEAKIQENPSSDLMKELTRAIKISEKIGTLAGQALAARKAKVKVEDTLGNWLYQVQEVLGTELSDKQIDKYKNLHEQYKNFDQTQTNLSEDLKDKVYREKAEAEIDKLKKEVQSLKQKTTPTEISSIEEEVNKRIDELYEKGTTKEEKKVLDSAIDKLEGARKKLKSLSFVDPVGAVAIADSAISLAIGVLKVTKNVTQAVDAAIEYIDKNYKGSKENADKIKSVIKEEIGESYKPKKTKEESVIANLEKQLADLEAGKKPKTKERAPYSPEAQEKMDDLRAKIKALKDTMGITFEKRVRALEKQKENLRKGKPVRKGKVVYTKEQQAKLDTLKKEIATLKTEQQKTGFAPDFQQSIEKAIETFNKSGLNANTAKDINAALKSLVSSGETNLDNITTSISDAFKGDITKADVISVIAGNYSKKRSKTELQGEILQLRTYSKLIDKLNKLEKGETPEKIRNTRDVKEKREISLVREKIKETEDRLNIKDEGNLKRRQANAEKRTKELLMKIKNKDFEPKAKRNLLADPDVKKKFPELVQKVKDTTRLKNQVKILFEKEKNIEFLKNRKFDKKALDFLKKSFDTAGKLKATLDASFMGVHAYYVLFTNPKLWSKATKEGIKKGLTKKRYEDYIDELHADEEKWEEYQAVGLEVLDYNALKANESEDILRRTFFDEHTVGGKKINIGKYVGTEFSDRVFIAMGNILRTSLYDLHTDVLKSEGKTYETHPEEFKQYAKYVNTLTGRAKTHRLAQNEIVNTLIWSPAKLSARLNMLGVADVVSRFDSESKGYYRDMSKELRKIAIKDIGKIIGGSLATMIALSMVGWDVDDELDSPTFGWLTSPDGEWQFNIFGENSGLVKVILKITGGKKTRKDSLEETARAIRGRLAPIPAAATDLIVGKTYMGDRVTDAEGNVKGDWIAEQITPLSIKNIAEGIESDPITGVLAAPLLGLGLPISNKKAYIEAEMERRRENKEYKDYIDYLGKTPEEEFDEEMEKLKKEEKENQLAIDAANLGVDYIER